MFTLIRTATDKYGTGRVVITAEDEAAAWMYAATEIKNDCLTKVKLPSPQEFDNNGEAIVAELQEELNYLLELDGKELAEAWNCSPLNNPDEFDTSMQIIYEPAPFVDVR